MNPPTHQHTPTPWQADAPHADDAYEVAPRRVERWTCETSSRSELKSVDPPSQGIPTGFPPDSRTFFWSWCTGNLHENHWLFGRRGYSLYLQQTIRIFQKGTHVFSENANLDERIIVSVTWRNGMRKLTWTPWSTQHKGQQANTAKVQQTHVEHTFWHITLARVEKVTKNKDLMGRSYAQTCRSLLNKPQAVSSWGLWFSSEKPLWFSRTVRGTILLSPARQIMFCTAT